VHYYTSSKAQPSVTEPTRVPSEQSVEAAFERGRRAWPSVTIKRAIFDGQVRALDVRDAGLEVWATDFYLACAAGERDREAIRIIDELFIARLARRIRKLGANVQDASDVLQIVRERLFTGVGPRIRAYNGNGPLAQWIKVVAIRTAVDRHRAESSASSVASDAPTGSASTSPGIEEALFKARYRAEFTSALRQEIRRLSQRDRTVLRLHLVEGISLEAIASARGVHRVTVARWVWNAGEILLEGLRRHFSERFGMVPSECDSLARLVGSQLSLGLGSLLAGG
jgi:RNA polymerase sigma-70 factor (ECF subfamily)